jgi:hypothetical protein
VNQQGDWQVGASVAVSGFRNAHGVWSARRANAAGPLPFVVTGIIHGLDTAAQTFNIGALTVFYDGAMLTGFSGDPANADRVRVTGLSLAATGALRARTVRKLAAALPGVTGDRVLIEGWVTRFASPQVFAVNDYGVTATAATSFDPPGGLDLASYAERFVRVSGSRRADGGVDADEVTVCNDPAHSIANVGHTATLLPDGRVLIVGGDRCNAFPQLFDPVSETFVSAGRSAVSRHGGTATSLADGRVLIVGGYFTETPRQRGYYPLAASAEIYDSATGRFALTGSMGTGRVEHTATLLADGRVLIAGGVGPGIGPTLAGAEIFDPRSGQFTSAGSMFDQRAAHSATLLPSGEVLVVGGWNGHRPDSIDDPPWDPTFAELFDPVSESFPQRLWAFMTTTRIGHAATPMPDGTVLVLGGFLPGFQNIHNQPANPAYAELYRPAGNIFERLPTPQLAHSGFTATRLNSGKVLVLGGWVYDPAVNNFITWPDSHVVNTARLVDPSNGSMVATAGLETARAGHTATLLNDGRVLVLGGTDSDRRVVPTIEFWSETN